MYISVINFIKNIEIDKNIYLLIISINLLLNLVYQESTASILTTLMYLISSLIVTITKPSNIKPTHFHQAIRIFRLFVKNSRRVNNFNFNSL